LVDFPTERPAAHSAAAKKIGSEQPDRPTTARSARGKRIWVGTTRPTDRRAQRGGEKLSRNDPTDRPTLPTESVSNRLGLTRPTDPPRAARRKKNESERPDRPTRLEAGWGRRTHFQLRIAIRNSET